jgi:hypothetical protein
LSLVIEFAIVKVIEVAFYEFQVPVLHLKVYSIIDLITKSGSQALRDFSLEGKAPKERRKAQRINEKAQ